MKKILLLSIALILFQLSFSQIPNGYYNTANGLSGNALRLALHDIIDGHSSISYDALWNAYQTTDENSNGKVWDIYTNCTFTFSSDQCGNYSSICDCYNREHTVPQSWFNEASPMKSDLFHVLPTDGKVNGYRSDYPYGECSSGTTYGLGKLGNCTYPGYSSKVFEPADEYKGDIARIYFYMATRYQDVMSGWSGESFSGGNLSTWTKNMLLEWDTQDPVSQKEIDRNNAVYSIQHNRNPYVDHPEYGCLVWSSGCSNEIYEIEKSLALNIYPNPASTDIKIEYNLIQYSNVTIDIYDITGKKVQTILNETQNSGNQTINYNFDSNSENIFQNGIYFINLKTDNLNIFEKFVYIK